MPNRRSFLQKLGVVSATTFLSGLTQPAWSRQLERALDEASFYSADQLVNEEDFWHYVQRAFTVSSTLINLTMVACRPLQGGSGYHEALL